MFAHVHARIQSNSVPMSDLMDVRRQTLTLLPNGEGDVLSHFISNHQAFTNTNAADESMIDTPVPISAPLIKKLALPLTGSETARARSVTSTSRKSIASAIPGSNTARGSVTSRPPVPVHAGTNRRSVASMKENAVAASPINTHKRKSSAALGINNSSSSTMNKLASTSVSGGLVKKARMSMSIQPSSRTALSSTSVNGNIAVGAPAPSPRKQWERRSMAPTIGRAVPIAPMEEPIAIAPISAPVVVTATLREWQGTAHWRLVLLRSARARLAASESSLAEAEAMHREMQIDLTNAISENERKTEQCTSLDQQLATSLNSEHMLRLAAEELGSTVEQLRVEAEQQKQKYESDIAALKSDLSARTDSLYNSSAEVAALTATEASLRASLAATEIELNRVIEARLQDEIHRKSLHKQVQDLKGAIRVFCRIRPSSVSEDIAPTEATPVYTKGASTGDFTESLSVLAPAGQRLDGGSAVQQSTKWTFDRVFSPQSDQASVFKELDDTIIGALDFSSNVSVFAYGATGSGKTHTMLGPSLSPSSTGTEILLGEHAGMIPRAIQRLFDYAEKANNRGWNYSFKASLLEIYNDEIVSYIQQHSYWK
jgi:hypothetical protein